MADLESRDERAARTHFEERYAVPIGDVNVRIEREVIGAAWGANGYTTLGQADELGGRIALGPGRRLLDVGTGRGWPGLYLTARTCCTLVATDMPFDPLAVAARRASAEGIADRVTLAAAAGADQPFRAGSFDAIIHTDVLC
jgi:2-polyprenyl-3-methyl-5-hydroxy-6-metoxy-1,4-benzoquinol methylase